MFSSSKKFSIEFLKKIIKFNKRNVCTVQGCQMMFSSRRSRNRHSANPNPKLHCGNIPLLTPKFIYFLNKNDKKKEKNDLEIKKNINEQQSFNNTKRLEENLKNNYNYQRLYFNNFYSKLEELKKIQQQRVQMTNIKTFLFPQSFL
ncbi:C2H2-type domain-containing protein [Meloidogyne graminicola]|uniref:C2H2-type domain-containing protein n=1 Tax=Meloidogyne graminicola TaxID=189291 RepID=A0A8S9ZFI5_9BILA|nr:C2H2-type domain-containing protein [Meloidogyne graminicola]